MYSSFQKASILTRFPPFLLQIVCASDCSLSGLMWIWNNETVFLQQRFQKSETNNISVIKICNNQFIICSTPGECWSVLTKQNHFSCVLFFSSDNTS